MDDIKNYNPAEAETLDSREVAEMVGKQHKHLLRDINGYIENMKQGTEPKVGLSAAELKIEPSEFFIPSTYTDSTGRELPCFLVTKKGCEFIANKLTGEKGTKFTHLISLLFLIHLTKLWQRIQELHHYFIVIEAISILRKHLGGEF